MVNYQNGKIYKLWSDQSDMLYIGSTTQPLSQRLGGHKKNIKEKYNITGADMANHTNIKIELIENFPCDSKESLHAREGYYIRLFRNDLLNKRIPGRTRSEYSYDYYKANSDTQKQKSVDYRAANREKISAYNAAYCQKNHEKELARGAKYHAINREWMAAKKRAKRAQQKEVKKKNQETI